MIEDQIKSWTLDDFFYYHRSRRLERYVAAMLVKMAGLVMRLWIYFRWLDRRYADCWLVCCLVTKKISLTFRIAIVVLVKLSGVARISFLSVYCFALCCMSSLSDGAQIGR